jgi:hypothetical protein
MTGVRTAFHEESAESRVEQVPLAHLSLELGHLYMEDFARGPDHLRAHFRKVRPWAVAAREDCAGELPPGRRPRISTCFLVDDYFTQLSSPAVVIPQLIQAAAESDLRIDYLARESACARAGDVGVAELVRDRLVEDPPPATNGIRPPMSQTGWLSNGQRSGTGRAAPAMEAGPGWRPARQNGAVNHSIFVDVELYSMVDGRRLWSCPFLAAVWQLLRLGMLRDAGRPVVTPRPPLDPLPQTWSELPPVMQLSPDAEAFAAYRTQSVLAPRFHEIETAVRVILSQVAVDAEIRQQILDRSRAEQLDLPAEILDRIQHAYSRVPSDAWR